MISVAARGGAGATSLAAKLWTGRDIGLVAIALTGLAAGATLFWGGAPQLASYAWAAATVPALLALIVQTVTSLRKGDVGLDLVAALSMSAALAFGEPLAGNVVALMYSGGQLLERFAEGRARRDMTALLGRVAKTAMRRVGASLSEVGIGEIGAGDSLLIRKGEVIPVDGRITGQRALVDLSALTGESVPVDLAIGDEALSGGTNIGEPFEIMALRPAAESTYAGIVRLVAAAQESKAPMGRLADRYAVGFLGLTLVMAGIAFALSGDPIRALAVLVVATPCPLILAVPVAVISGMSRAARAGALVKGGAVFEALAKVRTAVLDKTGTITQGRVGITQIRSAPGILEADLLRHAASLDQASSHVVATAIIQEAVRRSLILIVPEDVRETPGTGIEGTVAGVPVVVGGNTFVRQRSEATHAGALYDGVPPDAMTVAVAIGGRLAGLLVLKDQVRPDAANLVAELRQGGIDTIILASGDRTAIATGVGEGLGFDRVLGDLTPSAKAALVAEARPRGVVMMVGDGVNDAPALAAAEVGVAMGARGSAASSEAAGVVVLVDELRPLAQAMAIARRTRRIALQSVVAGLGLSVAAMVVAAFGYLPPVQGALLQEAIDVAVILNALRALL